MAFVYENSNPCQITVGDCVVRGVSKFIGKSWEDTYLQLVIVGLQVCDMPSSHTVFTTLLTGMGYKRVPVNETLTVEDFCVKHPHGKYLLCTGSHVVAVQNANWFDIFDSGFETVDFYFTKENGDE